MQAVLLALVALATTGAHAKCPSNIDAVTASVTQVFNGQRSPYDWTFSPTALSSLSPNGAASCGPSHIAQYSNGNCDANCNRQMSAPVSSTDKCEYAFTDGGDRVMNLKLSCDAGARALSIDPEVPVAQGMMGYTYDFTGKYAGVCEGGPDDGGNDDGDGSKSSGGCGGGCVFVIIFFVGAVLYVAGTVAFNYFKQGKRGKELAPHPEFWLLIPGLIKDGAMFSFQMITKPCRKDAGGSTYTQV